MPRTDLLLSIVCLLLYAGNAAAKQADYVDVGRTSNQNLGTWAIGDGAQVSTQVLCTASANYDNAYLDPPPVVSPAAVHEDYQFKVTTLAAPSGYYLYLDGIDTNTGNARIAVQFEHQDTKEPASFETLVDDTYDSHVHKGQFRNCRNGDNSELRMTLSAAELQKAQSGSYSADFRVGAIGGSSGTAVNTSDFNARISVGTASQVSSLDNITFGLWSGTGDLTNSDTFCVYSNTVGATYNITITSPNQDASSNFFLANAGATATIPYQLQFKDDLVAGGETTVTGATLSGVGNNQAPDCGGVDNARLTVTLLATDLSAATTDTYTDTITILVVPL